MQGVKRPFEKDWKGKSKSKGQKSHFINYQESFEIYNSLSRMNLNIQNKRKMIKKRWEICRKIMDFSRKIIIKYSESGKLPKYP